MTEKSVKISAQITPNPNTLKFVLDRVLIERGSINFLTQDDAATSPLVNALFNIEGVSDIMVGTNFVSVSKANDKDWSDLAEPITETIENVCDQEDTLVDQNLVPAEPEVSGDDSETVLKIKEILDNEVRPAIAMDGGDIVFNNYTDGVLYVHMQGACSNCPSATLTLKMGIENRLKEDIPELKEIVQL